MINEGKRIKLEKFLTQNWQRIVTVSLGVAVVVIVARTLEKDPNLASPAVALGTLTLAVVTVFSIFIANDREKRHRKNELDRERRDREERLLKEIRDWAQNILNCGLTPIERTILQRDKPEDRKLYAEVLSKQSMEFRRLNREGFTFKYIDLPEWKGLVAKSKKIRKEIGKQVALLDDMSEDIDNTAKIEAVETQRTTMNNTAESILEEAQNLRNKLFKSK